MISRIYIPEDNFQHGTVLHSESNFYSGEANVRIATTPDSRVKLNFKYQGDASLIKLFMVTDALRRQGAKNIDLIIPYFPGSRQDRVMTMGEALSCKVYTDLINHQRYNSVTIFDPHSDVVCALLNNVRVISNHELVREFISTVNSVLISPDAGANKKVYDLASKGLSGHIEVVRADKKRDVTNGKLSGFEVYCDNLEGKACYIVDDICSRGGTFIGLAKKLKEHNAGKIYLIISHYEGSADPEKLEDAGIERVFTTDSLCGDQRLDFIKQKNIWDLCN